MKTTKIEWTQSTWNPVTGCSKISAGCKNCYAEIMTRRLKAMGQEKYKEGFGKVVCHPESLMEPYLWKKGRMIFVNSVSDTFHRDVPYDFIDAIMQVIKENPQHTFQILTKRADLMYFYAKDKVLPDNLWLGVTAEDQHQANERIPLLLKTRVKVKFLSIEPMLGPIEFFNIPVGSRFSNIHIPNFFILYGGKNTDNPWYLNWVIVGGESGPHARPMHDDWVRSIRDQCQKAGVPFFFKQWGEWIPAMQIPNEWGHPAELKAKHSWVNLADGKDTGIGCGEMTIKVGKKASGSLLDGKYYKEMPNIYTLKF